MLRRLAPALVLAGSLCASPGAASSGAASPAGGAGGEPTLEELFREAEAAYYYYPDGTEVPIYRRAVALYPESAAAHKGLGERLARMCFIQDRERAMERGEDRVTNRDEPAPFAVSPPSGYCRALREDDRASCGPLCVEASAALCTAFLLDPSLFCDPSCESFCDQRCTGSREWYFPEEVIRSALVRHPRSACAHHHLARLMNDQERVEEAAVAYQRVLELAPGWGCVLRDVALLRINQGRYEEAEEAIDRLAVPGLRDLDLLGEIALRHIRDGRLESAVAIRSKLADRYRRAIDRNRSEQARHLAAGDEEEAWSAISWDIHYRAELASVLASIGGQRWGQGRYEEAQAAYRESVELVVEPSPAQAAFEARFHDERRSVHDSLRLEKLPTLIWIPTAASQMHAEMGDYEAAAGFLRQALDLALGADYRAGWGSSRAASIAGDLGRCLLWLGRTEEAAEAFRLGLDLEPDIAHHHFYLGLALGRLERFGEAEPVLRRAIDLDPEDPRAYRLLGWLIAEQGRLDEGLRLFRQAIDLAPRPCPDALQPGVAAAARGPRPGGPRTVRSGRRVPAPGRRATRCGRAVGKRRASRRRSLGTIARATQREPGAAELGGRRVQVRPAAPASSSTSRYTLPILTSASHQAC